MKIELASWKETPTKRTIIEFVAAVTDKDSSSFVPPEERIAVFDNDGTLWCEKPMYIQLDYILRKLAAWAQRDPELRSQQPWKAAWEKDFEWLGGAVTQYYQGDDSRLRELLGGILKLSAGQSVDRVEAEAKGFIKIERHPTLGLTYKDCIYLPMVELLRYLEANGFINYIVSGGGRDFMRGFADNLYGIPRERIIGSRVAYRFVENDIGGNIEQQAELDVIDDGPGKPIQIWNVIGRRPILAAGNSNGDIQMLAFAGGPSLPALRLLLLHDDPEREFKYVAGAEKIISIADSEGWATVSIKDDFKQIFPSITK